MDNPIINSSQKPHSQLVRLTEKTLPFSSHHTTPQPKDQQSNPTNPTLLTSICPLHTLSSLLSCLLFRFKYSSILTWTISKDLSTGFSDSITQCHTARQQLCGNSNQICLLLWSPSDSVRVRRGGRVREASGMRLFTEKSQKKKKSIS